jgi:hypothetical protein
MFGVTLNLEAPRNQAYTLDFYMFNTTNFLQRTGATLNNLKISKDRGNFATCANTETEEGQGWYSLVLTATEMDADVVLVQLQAVTASTSSVAVRITTFSTDLASIPTSSSRFSDKLIAVWQYLFHKRTVTTTQETLFKADSSTTLGTGTLSDSAGTFTKGLPS